MFFKLENIPRAKFQSRKIAIITLLFIAFCILLFSIFSRYPQLNQKVAMSSRVVLSGVGFDKLIGPESVTNIFAKISVVAINWYYTNWKGMTFGLILAALLMTLLSQFQKRSFRSPFLNTLSGALLGSPLGVCTNCAAPIGQGLFLGGSSAVGSIALLMSSPVFNFVIISMLFSIFPPYIGALKILANAIVILLILPLLVQVFLKSPATDASPNKVSSSKDEQRSWWQSFIDFSKMTFKNFIYVVKYTVPFMLIAGLLGSTVFVLTPPEFLFNIEPNLGNMLIFALVGAFLPVPIMFDIILVISLVSNGFPLSLGMVLLFSLGGTSIYALYITRKISNTKIALSIYLVFVVFSVSLGQLTQILENQQAQSVIVGMESLVRGQSQAEYIQIKAVVEEECSRPDVISSIGRESCKQRFLDKFVYVKALQKGDLGFCRFLKDSQKEDKCRLDITVDRAFFETDLKVCNNLPPKLIDKCLLDFFTLLKGKDIWFVNRVIGKIGGCEYFENSSYFRPLCQAVKSFSKSRGHYTDEYCHEITDKNQKDACVKHIALFKQKVEKSFVCDFQQSSIPPECRQRLLVQFIAKQENLNLCKKYKYGNARIQCKGLFLILSAIKEDQTSKCLELKNQRGQRGCINEVVRTRMVKRIDSHSSALSSLKESNEEYSKESWERQGVMDGPKPVFIKKENNLQISKLSFEDRGESFEKMRFSILGGKDVGINYTYEGSILDIFDPFTMGKGISVGRINEDYYPDLAIVGRSEIFIYLNLGDGAFIEKVVSRDKFKETELVGVSLVDLNNDQLSDLVVTGYGDHLYYLINEGESFGSPKQIELGISDTALPFSLSFGDIDQDGYLDIFSGNWPLENNFLVLNDHLKFSKKVQVSGGRGQTLSSLFSDIDGNGKVDLFVGNDWEASDFSYSYKNKKLKVSNIFNQTSFYTMSIDTADINNDLILDYFSVDMSFDRESKQDDYCQYVHDSDSRQNCQFVERINNFVRTSNVDGCKGLSEKMGECSIALLIRMAIAKSDPLLCDKIPQHKRILRKLCFFEATPKKRVFPKDGETKQVTRNVLLIGQGKNKFKDEAIDRSVGQSNWSWTAKFVDFNQDGFQDILVGNGFEKVREVSANILYMNDGNGKFIQKQKEYGLTDFVQTVAYSYVDFDFDGDMDVVAMGHMASPRIYVNHESENNFVRFILKNSKGTVIGSKVIIRYGEEKAQLRELKKGGGVLSFDEETIHFGLGSNKFIQNFEVHWADGTRDQISGPFVSNQLYIVEK